MPIILEKIALQYIEEKISLGGQRPRKLKKEKGNIAKGRGRKRQREIIKLIAAVREILACSNASVIFGHSSGVGFGCCFCSEHYVDPAELKQHNLKTHGKDILTFKEKANLINFVVKMDITNLRCQVCDKEMANIEQLVEHLNSVHEKKIYPDIKKRIFPFKFSNDGLRCCDCLEPFPSFRRLQEHMNSHYRNFICDICSSGFVTESGFKLHRTSLHDTGTFKCSQCDKVYPTAFKRKKHEDYMHGSEIEKNRSLCKICNERFTDYNSKRKHLIEVHGISQTEHKCQSCEKSFKTNASLLTHIKSYHLMLRPHKCPVCEFSFYAKNKLKIHMRLRHSGEKLQCDICMKKYRRKCALKQHIQLHLNDTGHKCSICGKLFVHACRYRRHMRIKHGEIIEGEIVERQIIERQIVERQP